MEEKEELSYLDFSTVGLFLIMGILHVIAPMLLGMSAFAFGMFIFGMLYTSLGLLIHKHSDNKKVGLFSFLVPLIGMAFAIFSLINNFNSYLFYVYILLDAIVIILRIYIYRKL